VAADSALAPKGGPEVAPANAAVVHVGHVAVGAAALLVAVRVEVLGGVEQVVSGVVAPVEAEAVEAVEARTAARGAAHVEADRMARKRN
jgi:hypothetical protein